MGQIRVASQLSNVLILSGIVVAALTALSLISGFSQTLLFLFLGSVATVFGVALARIVRGEPSPVNLTGSKGRNRLYQIGYASLISLMLVALNFSTYYRSISYDVIAVMLVAFIAVQILRSELTGTAVSQILGEIALLTFLNRSSILLLNLQPIWYDGYYHYFNTLDVLHVGHLSSALGDYLAFPLQYLTGVELILLSGFPDYFYLIVLAVTIVLLPLTVYLIVIRATSSIRGALLAALLSSATGFANLQVVSPHTIAFELAIVAVFLLFRSNGPGRKATFASLVLLLGFAVLLEQPSMALLLSTVLLFDFFRQVFTTRPRVLRLHFVSYIVIVLAYIIYAAGYIFNLIVNSYLVTTSAPASNLPVVVSFPYLTQLTFKYLPFEFFVCIYVASGLLLIVNKRNSASYLLAGLAFPGLILALLQYLALRPVPEALLIPYLPVLMAVPGWFVLLKLNRRKGLLVLILFMLALSQFSLLLNNDDNLYFVKGAAPQFSYDQDTATHALAGFFELTPNSVPVVLDYGSASSLYLAKGVYYNLSIVSAQIINSSNIEARGHYIVFNQAQISRWQISGSTPVGVIMNVQDNLDSQTSNVIYNSGLVVVYYMT